MRTTVCPVLVPIAAAVALLLLACGPRVSQPYQPAPGAGEPATSQEPAAAADDDRAIHRWAILSLTNAGYRCNEDTPTQCMTDTDHWIVTVATRTEPSQVLIMMDSYLTRVEGGLCQSFSAHLRAMASPQMLYAVDCNDTRAQFRLNTTLVYNQQIDMAAWMEQHRRSRVDSWNKLVELGAIQR